MLTTPRQNRLLAALSDVDQRAFADHLEAVPLSVGQVLERPGTPCTHAYFIDSGIVSVVAMGAQRRAEVAVVGNEGATGLAGVLPGARSGDELTIQVAGTAQRIATHDLTSVAAARPALRTLLLLYVHTTTIQASHTCLAYASGSILERLARWLLMAHDRVLGDVLSLTHEFLAFMLAVRRPGVTVAIQTLEGAGLIKATRGQITIVDRAGLIEAASGLYGIPEAEYEWTMNAFALFSDR